MKKSKLKTAIILILMIVLGLSVGVYAGYQFSANNVTYTNPDGTVITVKEALDELREKATSTAKSEASTATTHTAADISGYSWDELSSMAKAISNNSGITKDTLEVKVTMNGTTKTLGVGDYTIVDSKKVRILGFNHDTLAIATAYDGATTVTGKAGISFEYVDFLTSASMNSSDTNSGGWANCALRSTLNSTTYNSLSIKDKIKQVTKDYIPNYSSSSTTTCSDYLWLLSCAEIWNNGYNGGVTRGYASGTEGSQYKYYKSTLGNTSYSSNTDITKKPSTSNETYWWLRSPYYDYSYAFCYVRPDGDCGCDYASNYYGVAPGFSI